MNKEIFRTLLKRFDIEHFGVMNIYDYSNLGTDIKDIYNSFERKTHGIVETGIDYTLSLGRLPKLSKERFEEYASSIKKMHNIVNINQKNESTSKIVNEKQYNYHTGNLFYSPLFYERVNIFSLDYKIPLEKFNYNEILRFESSLRSDQEKVLHKQESCLECQFQSLCISRGVIYMMDQLNCPSCYMPRKNSHFITLMGTYPHKD